MSFGDAEYGGKRKRTRREIFLAEMEEVVPWNSLLALIELFYLIAGRGRHPYPIATMQRVHLMQNWFGLSDPAMEEALYEIAPMRQFARLTLTKAITSLRRPPNLSSGRLWSPGVHCSAFLSNCFA